jgi:outer membrane lipoprotein-sorting protein
VTTARDLLRIRQPGRKSRWAVPLGAVAVVGIVIAGSVIARGQTTPTLPARTTAQLLAAVDSQAALPSAMTAVVQENASLGLPDLPGSSDPLSGLSLLSGSHTFRIACDGPAKVRVAIPVTMGETDLRRDGNSVWVWDSETNRATHYVLPAGASGGSATPATPSVPTPQQLAKQILAAVGSTTTVGLQQNVTVAGQPAYQLSVAPKDSRSLIGQVRIAIDAKNSLPLQVQVFARGAASPAFSVGYTSLSFATPAASNFTFSPPPGAKVKTLHVPVGSGPLAGLGGLPNLSVGSVSTGVPTAPPPSGTVTLRMSTGNGKTVVVTGNKPIPPAVLKQMKAEIAQSLPASMPKAKRAALLKSLASGKSGTVEVSGQPVGSWSSSAPLSAVPTVFGSAAVPPSGGPTVLGKDWLSVAVLPVASAGGSGQAQGVLSALMAAATPVHGSWGSGRLLRTSLVSVLLLSDGRALVGAVVPSVLYADAARLR